MKKSFYNTCKFTIFCLLTSAFICVSTPVSAAENETAGTPALFTITPYAVGDSTSATKPAVIISNSGKVRRAQVGVSRANFFPDRTLVDEN